MKKKRVKAPGETFHLPQRRRYSGMAAASAATPPVLLSFSCSVRTEWGRGGVRVAVRGWEGGRGQGGAKAKFVSSAKTLF